MAFGINNLYNNIKDSILNLGNQLGLFPNKGNNLYSDAVIKDNKTLYKKENWKKLSNPYTFAVIDLVTKSSSPWFKDFELPLAPTDIQQTEEFATSIKPTQGGTVVSHSGNKYKTLIISGTTGIAPFRGAGGVDAYTGEAIFQPGSIKYKSGYEVFHELRNYFKAYAQFKKDRASSPEGFNSRLVFKNYKDGEYLIVELITFDMKRNSTRPFLYDYVMKFKVLKHFKELAAELSVLQKIDDALNKALNKIDVARGIFLRTSDIIRQVESTFDQIGMEPLRRIGLALRAAIGVGYTAADFPKTIMRQMVSTGHTIDILLKLRDKQDDQKNNPTDPLLESIVLPTDIENAVGTQGVDAIYNLKEGITLIDSSDLPENAQDALTQEIEDSLGLTRLYYEESVNDLIRVRRNAEDLFNVGSTSYDTLFDRVSSVDVDSSKTITNDEIDVLYGFKEAISGILDVMSSLRFFKSEYNQVINEMLANFNNDLPLQTTEAVRQIRVPGRTDLERIALDYLGDSNRWVEIAELNNLEYPYIEDARSDLRTIIPGDSILLPTPIINGFGELPQAKDIPSTVDLNYLQKSFGTDLKLTENFDLSMGNNRDLQVVSGLDNVAQSIILKLSYEKKDLIRYPQLGANLGVGSKIRPLSEIRDNIIQTLTSDFKIDSVTDLTIYQDGSAIYINFNVNLKNVDIPVPISISL